MVTDSQSVGPCAIRLWETVPMTTVNVVLSYSIDCNREVTGYIMYYIRYLTSLLAT